jgi:hypothetical protein
VNKRELLDSMESERSRLDAIVDTLGESEMVRPALDDEWSIKDALAHIAGWEQRFIGASKAVARGEQPDWPDDGWTQELTDQVNQRDFEANRDRALDDVVAESRRSYAEMRRLVERLSDDDLTNPGRWAWTRGHALIEFVSSNADEHYREHADAIEAWWAGQGA